MKFDFNEYVKYGRESSMNVWYPTTKNLDIPQPKTELVNIKDGADFFKILHGESDVDMMNAIIESANRLTYPMFMRADQTSGKHQFEDICLIKEVSDFKTHFPALIEDNYMKDLNIRSIYLREFIELDWRFKAFGGMPVASERRYFISDDGVVCHHPYWIEDAIHFNAITEEYQETDWKDALQGLNLESKKEIKLLSTYAEEIHSALPGNWSVDFAKGRNGVWYLIDMARSEVSWHPKDCEFYSKMSFEDISIESECNIELIKKV